MIANTELAKRRLLAEITVIAFIAVAFHESLNSFKESLRNPGFPWQALAIFVVFFLTTVRFFVGNHLHLQNDVILEKKRWWLVDFSIILLESTIIGFLGTTSPLVSENKSSFSFLGVLMALYAVDVVWIFGIQAIQQRWKWGKQEGLTWHWPWPWGALNTCLLVSTVVVWRIADDLTSPIALFCLAAVNGIAAFVIDICLALPKQLYSDVSPPPGPPPSGTQNPGSLLL